MNLFNTNNTYPERQEKGKLLLVFEKKRNNQKQKKI